MFIFSNSNTILELITLPKKGIGIMTFCHEDDEVSAYINKIKNEYNGELLNYNRDQEVYKEYNNNRLLCEDIIRGIDMTKDKDEMLILALKAISLLIKDDYFGQRNLEKLN